MLVQSPAPDPKHSNKTIRIVILADDTKPDLIHHHVSESPQSTSAQSGKISCNLRSLRPLEIGDDEASTSEVILREKCFHVSSQILAAHSPFFDKLFSNGMKESWQQHATIQILDTEEAAFMDLLRFMYSGELLAEKPSALRAVIGVADKFDVPSCIKLCSQLLTEFEMTLEVALLYLELDLNGLMADFVRPHLNTAKEFIVERFNHLTKIKLQEELLKLPLFGVEAVLSSDYLRVKSEDDIYDYLLKWVQSNYSDQLEERRTILNTLVRRFLRFPFLSTDKLESIMACSDIDPAIASELALGTLRYYKAQPPHQHSPDKFRKRAYMKLPLKAVLVDSSSSHPHSIIYLDIKRDECEKIPCGRKVESQTFFLGEHQFSLCVWHIKDEITGTYCFGLEFALSTISTTCFSFVCDISSRGKQSEVFVSRILDTISMDVGSQRTGWWDVFGVPWTTFIRRDSPYFINNVLLIRCDLTIKNCILR